LKYGIVIWIVKIIRIGKRSADEMDAGGGYWIMSETSNLTDHLIGLIEEIKKMPLLIS